MNIVVDTNVVLSGLLWGGPPNQILKWARGKTIRILGCSKTVDELQRVLQCRKFSNRLSVLQISPKEATAYFLKIVALVPEPQFIPVIIEKAPFDNLFLALAAQNGGKLIVSGDRHLLDVESFDSIQIVTPAEGVQLIARLQHH